MIITYQQLIEDSKELAYKIPLNRYKAIFGIPSGGILPGYLVADILQCTLLSAGDIETANKKTTLIVDDLIDSGRTLLKFKGFDTAVIYDKMHQNTERPTYVLKEIPKEWISFPHEKEQTGIEEHIVRLLEYVGEDVNRVSFKDTPKRVIRMYEEIFRGYKKELLPKITAFPNNEDGIHYDQMIIDSGYFYSICSHHMIPFFGSYNFSYIPDKKIVGLSKIARIVDYFAAKLQVQEQLTYEIVNYFEKLLKPKGIILILKARHLCKELRGVKKIGGDMITSEVRGLFAKDQSAKNEFLNLIKL